MEQESRAANDANDANAAGITLIELLVVMVIIALFATIVGSRVRRSVDKAKHVAAKSQISEYESMLDQFKLDVGRYPTNEEGLQALRVRPANVPNWDGPYSKKDLPIPGDIHTFTAFQDCTVISICCRSAPTAKRAATATMRTS